MLREAQARARGKSRGLTGEAYRSGGLTGWLSCSSGQMERGAAVCDTGASVLVFRPQGQESDVGMAEGEGFEPPELSLNGFQDRHLRPLGHPSATLCTAACPKSYRPALVLSTPLSVSYWCMR